MPDPTILSIATKANEITKPYQKGFIQFILVNFFGRLYKDFIRKSIIIQGEAEIEAQQVLEWKIANIDNEPSPILQQIHEDAEIEYRNIAGVLVRASSKVSPNANGNIDIDKLKRLKDLSKEFSSEDMQEIIAGILAGEYNNPGSFSLQTMSVVKNLSKGDLELFQRIAGLIINGQFLFDDILGKNSQEIRNEHKIHYKSFLYLHELGLINLNKSSLEMDVMTNGEDTIGQYILNFGGKRLFLKYNKKMNFNVITVTNTGQEIMSLLDIECSQKYCDWIENKLKGKGIDIERLKTEDDLKK